jgi:hypothetical protein
VGAAWGSGWSWSGDVARGTLLLLPTLTHPRCSSLRWCPTDPPTHPPNHPHYPCSSFTGPPLPLLPVQEARRDEERAREKAARAAAKRLGADAAIDRWASKLAALQPQDEEEGAAAGPRASNVCASDGGGVRAATAAGGYLPRRLLARAPPARSPALSRGHHGCPTTHHACCAPTRCPVQVLAPGLTQRRPRPRIRPRPRPQSWPRW